MGDGVSTEPCTENLIDDNRKGRLQPLFSFLLTFQGSKTVWALLCWDDVKVKAVFCPHSCGWG